MVNTEQFTNRLNKIMDFYDLSAAAFADKVDVGRSSISHLLSGRNKPSLEFVLKVIQAFPEVEIYWLLNGKGKFPKQQEQASPEENPSRDLFSGVETTNTVGTTARSQREIQRIVIFYSDGGFEAFEN